MCAIIFKINNGIDFINVVANILIGVSAIISLWFSIKALKRSEWTSAMGTAPSLVLRPKDIWVGTSDSGPGLNCSRLRLNEIIKADHKPFEIIFTIEFECFNVGRGVAFNISQPKSGGMLISEFWPHKTPLYQTIKDEPFKIELQMRKSFDDFFDAVCAATPVFLEIFYTNDQNNVFCKSTWRANIKPFDHLGKDLLIRETRLLNRLGKISYSPKPYKILNK